MGSTAVANSIDNPVSVFQEKRLNSNPELAACYKSTIDLGLEKGYKRLIKEENIYR